MATAKKNIPALRFPGFKGEWEEKKLGDITSKINSGKTPLGGEKVYQSHGILFIRSQNVNNDRLDLSNSTFISEKVNATMQNSIVKPNDILLNITGASLGRSCVVPGDFTIGNVNQHVCIIRLNPDFAPLFLQPIFSSDKGQKLFESLQTGSGREGLNFDSLKKLSLLFPSHSEQQKIASFLSSVDERLQQLQQQQSLLEQYKQGCMQQLFSQKLRFKDDKGNIFPGWKEKALGEIYAQLSTNSYSRENLNYVSGKIKNIHYGDIHSKFNAFFDIQNEEVPYINTNITNTKNFNNQLCKEGDLVVADASEDTLDVGKCIELINLNNEKVVAGLHTILIRPSLKEVSIGFGGYLLASPQVKKSIAKIAQGTKVYSISARRLLELQIAMPCPEEQTKIANFLSAIDQQINTVKQLIAQTQQFKKGLLQQMFV